MSFFVLCCLKFQHRVQTNDLVVVSRPQTIGKKKTCETYRCESGIHKLVHTCILLRNKLYFKLHNTVCTKYRTELKSVTIVTNFQGENV